MYFIDKNTLILIKSPSHKFLFLFQNQFLF